MDDDRDLRISSTQKAQRYKTTKTHKLFYVILCFFVAKKVNRYVDAEES
jgi:hypothetical protein